jgi:hypothetical protein
MYFCYGGPRSPTCFFSSFILSPPSSIGQAVSKSRDFLRRMAQPYKAVPGVSLLSLEHVRPLFNMA